jgi:hypothetical protein
VPVLKVSQNPLKNPLNPDILHSLRQTPVALSFQSKVHHLAALYDACELIVNTYKETDVFKVYSDEGLEDHIDFAATAREIMGLIAEGDIK